MKILMVHPHDVFSFEEPWTVRVRRLASELFRLGHEVTVVHFPLRHAGRREIEADIDPGVRVAGLLRACGPAATAANTLRLARLARGMDLLHVQKCFHYAAVPALVAAWGLGLPLHYDWDDWETQLFGDGGKPPSRLIAAYLAFLERRLPGLADTVSAASGFLRGRVEACGVPSGRVWASPVGVDLDAFRPGLDEAAAAHRKRLEIPAECVLYCGQLHGGQYAELMLPAAQILVRRFPAVKVVFVGGGHRMEELRERARRMGLERVVRFTGFVDHARVPEYMNMADVAVACFEDNAITRCKSPLKLAEYMACGRAIVASGVGDVPDMLGRAAVLVPPGDSGALAAAAGTLLGDEPLRHRLGRAARERAERQFGWDQTALRLHEAYREACRLCGRRRGFGERLLPLPGNGSPTRLVRFRADVPAGGGWACRLRLAGEGASRLRMDVDGAVAADAGVDVAWKAGNPWIALGIRRLESGVRLVEIHSETPLSPTAFQMVPAE